MATLKSIRFYWRKPLDFVVGFVIGFIIMGIPLWHYAQFDLPVAIILLALSIAAMYFGRKWLGIGTIIGAVLQFLFVLAFIYEPH